MEAEELGFDYVIVFSKLLDIFCYFSSKHWSKEEILLLLTTRLQYEDQFISGRRKKSTLWSNILKEIQEIKREFAFSKDECMKKYSNLLLTYNRIKKRNKKTGRDVTLWEHFEQLDQVYGTRHNIRPPEENIGSSSVAEENIIANSRQPNDPDESFAEESPQRKKPKNDILEFLQKEAKEDERRHQEYMTLERAKIDTEKEKIRVEESKTKEVKELKDLLQRMLE